MPGRGGARCGAGGAWYAGVWYAGAGARPPLLLPHAPHEVPTAPPPPPPPPTRTGVAIPATAPPRRWCSESTGAAVARRAAAGTQSGAPPPPPPPLLALLLLGGHAIVARVGWSESHAALLLAQPRCLTAPAQPRASLSSFSGCLWPPALLALCLSLCLLSLRVGANKHSVPQFIARRSTAPRHHLYNACANRAAPRRVTMKLPQSMVRRRQPPSWQGEGREGERERREANGHVWRTVGTRCVAGRAADGWRGNFTTKSCRGVAVVEAVEVVGVVGC